MEHLQPNFIYGFLFAVFCHLVASYFKPYLDRFGARVSSTLRSRATAAREERQRKLERLRNSDDDKLRLALEIIHLTTTLNSYLLIVLLFVATMSFTNELRLLNHLINQPLPGGTPFTAFSYLALGIGALIWVSSNQIMVRRMSLNRLLREAERTTGANN